MKKTIKIFLVDDHQLILEGIKSRLAETDHIKIVGEASNGKEAIEQLRKIHPDVILMDIAMPVMNGFDTARMIRAQYPQIKIIALTTYDEKGIIKKMLDAGALGYILKNVKREELLKAIETVMSGNNYFSSEISLALLKPAVEEILPALPKQPTVALTRREIEILQQIAMGLTSNEIAQKLFISTNTVDTHRNNIMSKLGVNNIASLIRYAIQNKLIE